MKDIFAQNGVIISAERPEFNTEENARRSALLVHKLVDLIGWDGYIIPCTGSWEGQEEQSYIVLPNATIVADPEKSRALMQGILGIASKFSQAAILVFAESGARLLELPEIEIIEGDPSAQDIGEALMYVYEITGGDGLLSDPLFFEEVDQDEIEEFNLDYTEVMGRYYVLEP